MTRKSAVVGLVVTAVTLGLTGCSSDSKTASTSSSQPATTASSSSPAAAATVESSPATVESSATTPSETASSAPVELTMWHGYTEADGKVLENMIKDFQAANPNITLKTKISPWAVIDDTLLPALAAGNGPDIVAMPAERLPVYAARGALAKLDAFYDTPSSPAAALIPGAVEMVTVDGGKYGVPTGFVPLAMFYNKALFAEAGIDKVPTNWDEWVTTARALTKDKNGDGTPEQYGLVLPDHQTVANGVWPTLFYGNGGGIAADGKAVINSPENAETLRFWHDAIAKDKISPTGVDGIKGDGLFSSGRVGMYLGGPWMASIAKENKIDYGIAAVPAGPKQQAASAIGVSMAITKQADETKRKAAEQFFAYFLDAEQSVTWSLGSGWPPLRTDVSVDKVSTNEVVAALTKQAQFGKPLLPGVVSSTDVLSAVDALTQQAIAGKPIDALLTNAQVAVQEALDSK